MLDGANENLKIRIDKYKWLEEKKKYHFAAIIKLENAERDIHAILLKIQKLNKGVQIQILDPLRRIDSPFVEEMEKLALKLSNYPGIIKQIYSGIQDKMHATCGDICLIILQEFLEELIGTTKSYCNAANKRNKSVYYISNRICHCIVIKLIKKKEYLESQEINLENLQNAQEKDIETN